MKIHNSILFHSTISSNNKQKNNYTVAIAGNPNVGKSTIFNALTGARQHTGNWTGKTVSNATGTFFYNNNKFVLVDIPGTYSLTSNSDEEQIAKNYLESNKADVTIIVLDATTLERNLYLVFQILEITSNVILCVNLLDEAEKKGIKININKLSESLGIPVVSTIAKKKKTLKKLVSTINDVCTKKIIITPFKSDFKDTETVKIENYIFKAETLCKDVCSFNKLNYDSFNRKVDKVLTSKKFGIPIMLLFLCLIFWLTIVGANYPSQLLSNFFNFLGTYLQNFLNYISIPNWIRDLLMNGIYKTLTWVIAVMLPPMAIFFPLFTLLEDLGYLPRISFNLDKCFHKACSSGKQAITMCMGFGCNAVGVCGCRIINSPREKLLAILTNSFIPCNGRFPFLISVATLFVGCYFSGIGSSFVSCLFVVLIVLLGIFLTLFISKVLSKTILKGTNSSFILELPSYRKPQLVQILTRSFLDRTIFILGRAISVAAPAGIVIWLFANIYIGDLSILTYTANFLNPFAQIMGLDGYILTAFILGLPANEIVFPLILMSYASKGYLVDSTDILNLKELLVSNGWTFITALNVMIFTLLHFPCATTLLTIKKETKSKKWTFFAFLLPTVCGITICIFTNLIWNLIF